LGRDVVDAAADQQQRQHHEREPAAKAVEELVHVAAPTDAPLPVRGQGLNLGRSDAARQWATNYGSANPPRKRLTARRNLGGSSASTRLVTASTGQLPFGPEAQVGELERQDLALATAVACAAWSMVA